MTASEASLKMSELAERSGVSAPTIRHCIREGLLGAIHSKLLLAELASQLERGAETESTPPVRGCSRVVFTRLAGGRPDPHVFE